MEYDSRRGGMEQTKRPGQQSWTPRDGAEAPEAQLLVWGEAPSTHQILKETQMPEVLRCY